MWPLAVCGIAAAALIVWKLADISVRTSRNTRVLDHVDALLARGMIAEALSFARESDTEAGRVVAAGLSRRGAGTARMARTMGSAATIEAASLERGLLPLATLAVVTPLVGFLVAVMAALRNLRADAVGSLLDTAGPSSVVLPAAAGLAIGIVAAVFYHFWAARIARITARIGASGQAAVAAIAAVEERPAP